MKSIGKPIRPRKVVTLNSLQSQLRDFEYAVRGELAIKAGEYVQQLQQGKKLPFSKVIYCNIGNPQQLGQQPITFTRQGMRKIDYCGHQFCCLVRLLFLIF